MLRQVALQIGFQHHSDSEVNPPILPFFSKFGLGNYMTTARISGDVLTGSIDGNYVVLFDQEGKTPGVEWDAKSKQTVLCFELDSLVARFHLKPRWISDKIVVALQKSVLTRWAVSDPLSSGRRP